MHAPTHMQTYTHTDICTYYTQRHTYTHKYMYLILLLNGTHNVYLHQQDSQLKATSQLFESLVNVLWVELVVT